MKNTLLKILLLEDDFDDQRLFGITMRKSGLPHSIDYANSLDEARVLIGKQQFDAILADLSLPDSHGQQTVSCLRQLGAKCPIIVLTGLQDEQTEGETLSSGAQDYLIKGQYSHGELVRAINHAQQRQQWVNKIDNAAAELTALEMLAELDDPRAPRPAARHGAHALSRISTQEVCSTVDAILHGLRQFRNTQGDRTTSAQLDTLLTIRSLAETLSEEAVEHAYDYDWVMDSAQI